MVPAIGGVISILDSALSFAGPQLSSFVLLSSISAIAEPTKPDDYAFTEADWNVSAEGIARKEFTPGPAYGASKTAAERALWKFGEDNKPSFSLCAINPAVVTGPPI